MIARTLPDPGCAETKENASLRKFVRFCSERLSRIVNSGPTTLPTAAYITKMPGPCPASAGFTLRKHCARSLTPPGSSRALRTTAHVSLLSYKPTLIFARPPVLCRYRSFPPGGEHAKHMKSAIIRRIVWTPSWPCPVASFPRRSYRAARNCVFLQMRRVRPGPRVLSARPRTKQRWTSPVTTLKMSSELRRRAFCRLSDKPPTIDSMDFLPPLARLNGTVPPIRLLFASRLFRKDGKARGGWQWRDLAR